MTCRNVGSVANLADRSAWCTFAGNDFGGERVMIEFKGSHFERDVILWAVRWDVAYPISYRQLEEMMEEHGIEVDHATLNRWVLKYVPLLDQDFQVRKEAVGPSWRMDETYVSGQSNIIIDYATARRREEPISTAITESTVQWLLHRRMNAQQQMRWSPRGAHLMLKVRTSVVNGRFDRDNAVAERWARRPFRRAA
jgi:hypothetical protein